MAPADRAPNELLQYIFLLFRPVSHEDESHRDVVQIAGVCQAWRRVVLNTPGLWTFIDIQLPWIRTPEAIDPYIQRLETLFGRTGRLAIDVIWNMAIIDSESRTRLMTCIRENAPFTRWRSLTITGAVNVGTEQLESCGSFEQLEELTIAWYPSDALMVHIDQTAQNLRRLEVARALQLHADYPNIFRRINTFKLQDPLVFPPDLPDNISQLHIPHVSNLPNTFPAVTHLNVDIFMFEFFNSELFPNLEFLKAEFISAPMVPITFDKLRQLIVLESLKCGIRRINAPRIRSLQIIGKSELPGSTAEDLNSTVQDPHFDLAPVTVYLDLSLAPNMIVSVLRVSGQVQHLRILFKIKWPTWNIVAEMLTPQNFGGAVAPNAWDCCCPQLRTLEVAFDWIQSEQEEWFSFAQMIARRRVGSHLESVKLSWKCGTETLFPVEVENGRIIMQS